MPDEALTVLDVPVFLPCRFSRFIPPGGGRTLTLQTGGAVRPKAPVLAAPEVSTARYVQPRVLDGGSCGGVLHPPLWQFPPYRQQ